MTLEQPTPFLKLCQLLAQGNPDAQGQPQTIFYQEDCNGNVLVNNPTYPLTLTCEVIDFVSQDAFTVRGAITAFEAVTVTLPNAPASGVSIRHTVFQQLQATYPTLVI